MSVAGFVVDADVGLCFCNDRFGNLAVYFRTQHFAEQILTDLHNIFPSVEFEREFHLFLNEFFGA